ncbi:hypothetical protein [Leclercia adecarboxylata]|uniref:hypothetical protein n=1 Tax=Leclercia adecarboxylata TaxID=83655 RepID=UPI00384FF7ED
MKISENNSFPTDSYFEYEAAFERLKSNNPIRIKRGSPITQNNIAREAGKDPSAFKKSRYPTLIQEIQIYIKNQAPTAKEKFSKEKGILKGRIAALEKKVSELKMQRDHLASLLVEAEMQLIEWNKKMK